ncbi:YlxQ family RNA-binding protein [Microaerobacter geothermalis]|uniref:YlxQ family RNA-binding protein n=1 Tax=Microaerobacter geothermalis TaxID=674972 RepID=UPI001EEB041F|nr:YlxQ family RNA-binding protein [Microaerobacter geothermalis]MCF6093191.1 YlxQ family RNA-binding protein [Microaerobacter geothermalis]
MIKNKLSLLGLAMKAGKVISGEELVLRNIRNGRVKLVLIAKDASYNTIKKFTDKCSSYHIPYLLILSREELGKAIGKPNRVIIGIMDDGFSKRIKELFQ